MSAEIAHFFMKLPSLSPSPADTAWRGVEPDAFVRRIGAAGNRFGEWRRVAANKGWLRVERVMGRG